MPALPPRLWTELYFDSAWNTVTRDVRQTSQVTVTRGLSSESSSIAEPTASTLTFDSRDHKYAPRNPLSPLYGKIGRNTPLRWGYYTGSPWVQSDGTGTSVLTTPTQTAFNVTDLDVRLDVALESWEGQQGLASRYTASGNNRSWGVYLAGTGQLALVWSADGTATTITQFSTVPVTGYNGQRRAIRVTLDVNNGAGGYEVRFYTGRTVDDDEWSLLGDPVVGVGTTAVFAASSQIEFGDISGLVLNCLTGKGYAMRLMTSIGGSTAMRMTTQDAAPGGSSFTSGALVWTVTGTGVSLSNKHVRMSGEVPSWPPVRDLSGNDTVVDVEPSGVLRRMDAGNKPEESAILRYVKAALPLECWPLTDQVQTGGGRPLFGSDSMVLDLDFGTNPPRWGEGSVAEWIEPVVLLPSGSDGKLIGYTSLEASAATGWSVDFLYNGKQDVDFTISDFGDGSDADPRINWTLDLDVSANQVKLTTASIGNTSTSSALQATISSAGIFDGMLHHIRLQTSVSGANGPYVIYIDGVSRASGTATGYGSEAVQFVRPGWFYTSFTEDIPSLGYIIYWGSSAPTAATVYDAATGFQAEKAGARIERVADESGYVATVSGETTYQRPMGIQGTKKLLDILNETNATNFGYFLDSRDRLELIHRGGGTLWNQPPGVTLDFSSGVISAPFRPVDDDKLTENDVSVQREFGAAPVRYTLDSGALSTQDPPNGVGRYDKQYTYSLYTDDDADQVAYMRLHLGTYDGVRYARITLDLANERVYQMIDDILRLDVGDKLRLSNVPEDHGPDDVDVLIQGYEEEAGPTAWRITFNCVPAEPWNALTLNSSTYGTLDTGGCHLVEDLDLSETGADVLTTGTSRWVDSATYASDFPFDVRTGGEVMRVTACTGTTTSQTFTVVRAVNGILKTHLSGQDIRLAYPVYVAM